MQLHFDDISPLLIHFQSCALIWLTQNSQVDWSMKEASSDSQHLLLKILILLKSWFALAIAHTNESLIISLSQQTKTETDIHEIFSRMQVVES